ncbi:DNA polymerase eta isoform X1 [Drosophila albomicans]|uniref:DNA polymerase eta n=1 Tax=Drosophila albomicans TaxID=7291 RepID=A0A6P8WTK4_DROAB|nr:DNA polymerase eta isoform X1 [Drosophila albomicans]
MSSSTRAFVGMQNKYDRVVLLVDMDCFFCQVEVKQQPEYQGKPLAVVQYNAWRGGGIIAVNYAARAKGVTRHMRGDEAKALCHDIILCRVPNIREKADTSKYRDAGKEVANVLQRFTQLLERASVDEAYLDITETVNQRVEQLQTGAFALQPQELVNCHAVGYDNIGEYVNKITNRFANPYMDDERFMLSYDPNDLPAVRQSDLRLLIGACIAGEVRAAVKAETGYECSAGIAHNKILAKLAAGMNKPNKQTILPLAEIPALFDQLPVGKIKGMGGKFGETVCETLGVKFLGQVLKYSESELQRKLDDKSGTWLHNIARGIDLEAVTPRFYSKSIGCCKKFPGRNNITGLKTLQHWLSELASEINDRLEKDFIENNRKAKQMVVQYVQDIDGNEVASSRSTAITQSDQETLTKQALELIKANTKTFLRVGSESALNNAIKFLGISVGKFESASNAQNSLQTMFANQAAKKRRISVEDGVEKVIEKVIVEQKPKQTDEAKMKGFFANYLQSKKSETKIVNEAEGEAKESESNGVDPEPQISTAEVEDVAPQKKSFFEQYKRKLIEVSVPKEATEEKAAPISTPPEFKGSFFAKYLQQRKEEKKSTEQLNKSSEDDDSADMQGLAAELDEIESSAQEQPESEKQPSTSKRKFEQVNSSDSVPNSDYKSSYAEFAMPEIRGDLIKMIKCDECDAQIPDDIKALQTHRDHHFAQQLSRQLRVEQREEMQRSRLETTTTASPSPTAKAAPSKKSKKSAGTTAATTTVKPVNSITKFLTAKQPEPPASSSGVQMELCSECKAYIKSVDMPEHLDYHIAKKLQRELNQLEVRTITTSSNKKISPAAKKQMSSTLNSTPGNKSITQFFSQSN